MNYSFGNALYVKNYIHTRSYILKPTFMFAKLSVIIFPKLGIDTPMSGVLYKMIDVT